MTISVRHWFERRLGLFPVVVSEKYGMYALTTFADYPFCIPDRKVDFEKEDISMGWNLLSYKKKYPRLHTLKAMNRNWLMMNKWKPGGLLKQAMPVNGYKLILEKQWK